MHLINFYNKIVALSEFDAQKTVADIINENHEFIEELVRNQLSEGKTGTGERTMAKWGTQYTFTTIRKKNKNEGLSAEVSYITMYETGEFYLSLKVITDGKTFEVTSDVPQFSELDSWNNEKLIELSPESCMFFRDEILIPQFIERFKLAMNV